MYMCVSGESNSLGGSGRWHRNESSWTGPLRVGGVEEIERI